MKKLLLAITLLLLAACGPFSSNRPFLQQDIHTGTVGVTMDFMESAPPTQVREGQQFPVYLDIRNEGAHDIERGYWRFGGYNINYLSFNPRQGALTLRGKSLNNPTGERQVIQVQATAGMLATQQQDHTAYFEVNYCYPYETGAAVQVCVDTDYFNTKQQQKPCTVGTSSISAGQGGPVGITSVESLPPRSPTSEDSLTNTDLVIPRFRITIANLGNGKVIDENQVLDYCQSTTSASARNIVSYDVKLSDLGLVCSSQGRTPTSGTQTISLDEDLDSTQIECELAQGISPQYGTYEAPLQITLNYGYVNTLSQSIDLQSAT